MLLAIAGWCAAMHGCAVQSPWGPAERGAETELHRVAEGSADPSVVQALLDAGADPNARDGRGRTPLMRAAAYNTNPAVVRMLLDAGADAKARARDGDRPLNMAARHNANPEVIQALLDAGAAPLRGWLREPLKLAVASNNPAVIRTLLDAGASPNAGGVLKVAIDGKRSIEVIRLLLGAGANPNKGNGWRETPLHHAAEYGDAAVIQALLEAGANPSRKDGDGRTPLHVAASPAAVQALLDAEANLEARDDRGRTPLHRAAIGASNVALIQTLLDAGADMRARDERNRDPLSLAVMFNAEAVVVEALLKAHGGSPNGRSESGSTLLHLATVANNSPDVVRLLIDVGGDANAVDGRKRTPLHIAAMTAKRDTRVNPFADLFTFGLASLLRFNEEGNWRRNATGNVELLLGSGADPNAVDTNGQTPLHAAAIHGGYPQIVELLFDAGADPGARDNRGKLPVDYAEQRGIFDGTAAYDRLSTGSPE